MKIVMINGSQKTGESNSGILLRELKNCIKGDYDIFSYTLGSKRFAPEIYDEIITGDVMVMAFPLYVDSIPSNVLGMLIELEDFAKGRNAKDLVMYAIINNGFYEGKQTHIAFEIIQNWCEHAGIGFGGGIGQGAGEMLGATKNTPISKGPFNNLGRELALLAEKMAAKGAFGIKYLSPYFPRFLWRFMANHAFWQPMAHKNNLKKTDITSRPA
jgi:multimeric flavodoxin WrbA